MAALVERGASPRGPSASRPRAPCSTVVQGRPPGRPRHLCRRRTKLLGVRSTCSVASRQGHLRVRERPRARAMRSSRGGGPARRPGQRWPGWVRCRAVPVRTGQLRCLVHSKPPTRGCRPAGHRVRRRRQPHANRSPSVRPQTDLFGFGSSMVLFTIEANRPSAGPSNAVWKELPRGPAARRAAGGPDPRTPIRSRPQIVEGIERTDGDRARIDVFVDAGTGTPDYDCPAPRTRWPRSCGGQGASAPIEFAFIELNLETGEFTVHPQLPRIRSIRDFDAIRRMMLDDPVGQPRPGRRRSPRRAQIM